MIDSDSDNELQEAYARGELKPGLNIPVEVISKESVNNVNAIKQKLEDIKLKMKWVERLDTVNGLAQLTPEMKLQLAGKEDNSKLETPVNDFQMEMNFYRQAQAAVLESIPRFTQMGIKTKRPEDYFAEMAKTDNHMKKIREKLMSKQMSLERSQKAKKLRELRKYGKKVHHEVLQQRHKDKKDMMEAVKRYRKGDKSSLDFLENNKKKGGPTNAKRNAKAAEKRIYKESKYGYGGKKKRSKYNTAKSSAEMTGFSSKINSKSKARPGKERRQNMKNRKKN